MADYRVGDAAHEGPPYAAAAPAAHHDEAGAWPSGLALGPYGAAQVANFVVSGLLLCLFAVGLHLQLANARGSTPLGPAILSVAGVAMALMGFRTDSIERVGPVVYTA